MIRVRWAVVCAVAFVLAGPVQARAQAPAGLRFTVEEMLKLRRVSDPPRRLREAPYGVARVRGAARASHGVGHSRRVWRAIWIDH